MPYLIICRSDPVLSFWISWCSFSPNIFMKGLSRWKSSFSAWIYPIPVSGIISKNWSTTIGQPIQAHGEKQRSETAFHYTFQQAGYQNSIDFQYHEWPAWRNQKAKGNCWLAELNKYGENACQYRLSRLFNVINESQIICMVNYPDYQRQIRQYPIKLNPLTISMQEFWIRL